MSYWVFLEDCPPVWEEGKLCCDKYILGVYKSIFWESTILEFSRIKRYFSTSHTHVSPEEITKEARSFSTNCTKKCKPKQKVCLDIHKNVLFVTVHSCKLYVLRELQWVVMYMIYILWKVGSCYHLFCISPCSCCHAPVHGWRNEKGKGGQMYWEVTRKDKRMQCISHLSL